jgi:hypothetical protein
MLQKWSKLPNGSKEEEERKKLVKHRGNFTFYLEHCPFFIVWGPFTLSNYSKTFSEILLILNMTKTSDYVQHNVCIMDGETTVRKL